MNGEPAPSEVATNLGNETWHYACSYGSQEFEFPDKFPDTPSETVDPHGMGSLGLGDNRGSMANDSEGRFRVETKVVVDRASGQVTLDTIH